MIRHFSQEPIEGTFHIKDADLQKMMEVLADVNIEKCPYFDLSDKYGNSARYYREDQCSTCKSLENGDTLYLVSNWGGEIGYTYIGDIKYCPVCGKRLDRGKEK